MTDMEQTPIDIDQIVADMRKIATRQKEKVEKKYGTSSEIICENPICGYPCVGSYHVRGSHKFCSRFCAEATTGLEFDPSALDPRRPSQEIKLRSKEETWDVLVEAIRKHGNRRVPISFLMTLKELGQLDTLMAMYHK